MKISFDEAAFSQYNAWHQKDKKTFKRIQRLIDDILRTPFHGIGKPEPLRHTYAGYYSRRIDAEHRIIYKVEFDTLIIISCSGHYE